ncbi:MAG: tetratricopeptide repeat protein [Pseudanabaenaceae cyanobacterium]
MTRTWLEQALQYHRSGQWRQAEQLYRQVLAQDPQQADAWHLLGVLALQVGDYTKAVELIQQAINLQNQNPNFYNSLGEAFRHQGQGELAIKSYRAALALKPDYGEVWMNLGLVYQALQRQTEAIDAYTNALQYQPNLGRALNNLGVLYRQQGEYEQAIAVLERAIQLHPNYSNAYDNLGLVYQSKGDYDRAISYHQQAIRLDNKDYHAYNNLGNAYQELQELDKAIECYRQAIKANPHFPAVYLNLGNALCSKRQFREAIGYYQRGLELQPQWGEIITAIANAYRELGLVEEALNYYEQALGINPQNAVALWNYHLMLPVVYRTAAEIKIWRDRFRHGLGAIQAWLTQVDSKTALQGLGAITNFYLQYQGENDRDLQQQFGEMAVQIMAANYPQWATCHRPLGTTDKIKVGFISSFWHEHTVAKLFQGWLQYLEGERFTIYGYFTGKKADGVTQKIASYCHYFHHIATSLEAIAQQIAQDALDVLIFTDVGMCPTVDKIAALKLAPIQCVAWGHPITTGLKTIDYFLSSELMEPPDSTSHYCEQLVLLPGIGITYTPPQLPTRPHDRSYFRLSPADVVYLSCQSLYKYLPQFDFVFPRIAQQVKGAKFVFIESIHSPAVTKILQERLAHAFQRYDLNWQNYCCFVPRLQTQEYLRLNLVSDVFLDTIEWSGGNTTLEALACHLPVVTVPGKFMRGRHSLAMLTQLQVTETIGSNLEEYIDIAVKLGNDRAWRLEIKQKINNNAHLLFNDQKPTQFLSQFLTALVYG